MNIKWERLNEETTSLYEQGHYNRVIVVFKKALRVTEKAVESNHPEVTASLNDLARLYDNQGLYAKAESLFRRALAIDEKAFGVHDPLSVVEKLTGPKTLMLPSML
jgi:tetratricopeptide (TPR) repeat protein